MVDNVNGLGGAGAIQPRRGVRGAYRFAETPAAADSVEISSEVLRLRGVEGGVRMDKVLAIRGMIATGAYEFTDAKLGHALDRAMDEALGNR